MVAQIILPVCDWCRELEEGSWWWWIRGCWQYNCTPAEAGVIAVAVTIAAYVGVQLWSASRQPKA